MRLAFFRFMVVAFTPLGGVTATPGAERLVRADEAVALPAFEVSGTRPWWYAEMAGYQVLSLASERDTRTILERFDRAARFAALLLPPGSEASFTAPATLYVRHFAGDHAIAEVARHLDVSFKPLAFTLQAQDTFIRMPSAELARTWVKDRHGGVGEHLYCLLGTLTPRVPVWYRASLGSLVRPARGGETWIELERQDWEPRELMPLADVLAITTAEQLRQMARISPDAEDRYLRQAALFVQWGCFADGGKRRPAFLELVRAASLQPIEEATFQQYLGMTIADARRALVAYARREGRRPARLELPPDLTATSTAPVWLRPATLGEVARVVGESYLLLGENLHAHTGSYRTRARTALRAAYDAGDRDPRLLAVLGLFAIAEGETDSARANLEAAVADRVPSPRAHVALARLRLEDAIARHGADVILPLADVHAVLAPLRRAMTMHPQLPDTYRLAADAWSRHAAPPPKEELAALAHGAQLFSRETDLVLSVARLQSRAGHQEAARELADLGLGWPDLDQVLRGSLLDLREQLHAGTTTE